MLRFFPKILSNAKKLQQFFLDRRWPPYSNAKKKYNIFFLDQKWPPPPFGTFPKIHRFWYGRASLSILVLIPPSPVKQQHLCQPVYLFLHLPASDPIIWLLSVCLSLCFCAAHTTFWPLRQGSTRKQEWKFQIGSRDWTGKVGKGGKVGSGCYGPNLFATFIPKLSQPTDKFCHSVS